MSLLLNQLEGWQILVYSHIPFAFGHSAHRLANGPQALAIPNPTVCSWRQQSTLRVDQESFPIESSPLFDGKALYRQLQVVLQCMKIILLKFRNKYIAPLNCDFIKGGPKTCTPLQQIRWYKTFCPGIMHNAPHSIISKKLIIWKGSKQVNVVSPLGYPVKGRQFQKGESFCGT